MKALQGRECKQHPHTLSSYNNLAECLRAQGKAREAEEWHRNAKRAYIRACSGLDWIGLDWIGLYWHDIWAAFRAFREERQTPRRVRTLPQKTLKDPNGC